MITCESQTAIDEIVMLTLFCYSVDLVTVGAHESHCTVIVKSGHVVKCNLITRARSLTLWLTRGLMETLAKGSAPPCIQYFTDNGTSLGTRATICTCWPVGQEYQQILTMAPRSPHLISLYTGWCPNRVTTLKWNKSGMFESILSTKKTFF